MTAEIFQTPDSYVQLSLESVILAVTCGSPRVLSVGAATQRPALPSGPLDEKAHPTLERGVREGVELSTGLKLAYVEQLYTFGDRVRDARRAGASGRVVSAAYLALIREQPLKTGFEAAWLDIYGVLPWEDWRAGQPKILSTTLQQALASWAGRDPRRRERSDLCFGLNGAPFDPERTLERYELLWEAGLVAEATGNIAGFGTAMALDHRRILATALGRLRGKIKYRPVVFELLPAAFTLLNLQRTVEALAGNRLHKQNFRRLVEQGGLVEGIGQLEHDTGGRPAELFRFRHEVFRERPAPGVYFPGAWWGQ